MRSEILKLFIPFCIFQSCSPSVDNSVPKDDTSILISDKQDKIHSNGSGRTEKPLSLKIAGEEVKLEDIEDGVETVVDITKTIVQAGAEIQERERGRERIKLYTREKMFVYQLGIPVKGKKQIMRVYNNFSDKENVYAFRNSRNEYLLVKYQDKDEAELDEELEEYKELHASEVIGEIKRIDLSLECGKGEKLELVKSIGRRKGDIQLDCITCK